MPLDQGRDLAGAIVVITGSSRGLGRETAEAFGERGASVVINYRSNDEAAEETATAVREAHPHAEAITVQADMSRPEEIDNLFDRTAAEFGRLDVFVHNAAVTAFKPLREVSAKDIDLTYDVAVKGFVLGAQRALDLMDDGGRIVAVTGNDNHTYMPLHGLLGSAKSALENLVRYLAVEEADNDVEVNAVNPGLLDKENYYAKVSEETARTVDELTRETPKGAVPLRSVAEGIVTLAEPRHEWITGEVLHVDGGLNAR